MSADNVVYVQHTPKGWYVWEQSMSVDCKRPRRLTPYPTRAHALEAAHDLVADFGVVEYGVVEI